MKMSKAQKKRKALDNPRPQMVKYRVIICEKGARLPLQAKISIAESPENYNRRPKFDPTPPGVHEKPTSL